MKQQIKIGVQGNDGTGDSIRDAFRKVNENFDEVYGFFGKGTISFSKLDDGTEYTGNQLIMAAQDGSKLSARTLIAGTNIAILSNPTSVTIASKASQLSDDATPEIKHPFNANLQAIGRIPDPSELLVQSFNALWADSGVTTTLNQLAVNVGYANKNFLSVQHGIIGHLDSSGNFVQPSLTTGATVLDTTSEFYDPTLTGNYLTTSLVPRKDLVYRGGDTMTGPLYLNDHPKDVAGLVGTNNKDDLQAATAYYVDNKTFSSNVNLYVATSGDDLQTQTPAGKEGRFWNYAFKSIGAALLHAEMLINVASQEPGPYKQRVSYTIGPDQYFSKIKKVALTGGNSTDSGYIAAFDLLQANRQFIQAETIAYINKKYVNAFAYDPSTITVKINSLLNNIGNDLVLGATDPDSATSGTNYNSYWEGVSYIHDNTTSEGLIQWIETVNFIRDQIIDFSYNTTALQAYTAQLINAISYDLLFQTNYRSVQTGMSFKTAGTNISPAQLGAMLTINPITITSAECNGSQVTLYYATQSSILYPVKSEILINATLTGIKIITTPVTISSVNNSNAVVSFEVTSSTLNSVTFSNTSLSLNADTFNVTGTVDCKNLINLLLLTPAVRNLPATTRTSLIVSNINVIKNYVLTGTLPEIIYPSPPQPSVGYDVTGHNSAKQLLLENIAFIQAETLAFLSSEYPNVLYDRALRIRDVKYIVWSLVYDLMYGGNSQSVYFGQQYWVTASNYPNASESEAYIASIRHINVLAQSIIQNSIVGVTYQQSVRQYRNDTLTNGVVASSSLSSNITLIADIVTSLTNVPGTIINPLSTTSTTILKNVYDGIIGTVSVYTTGATTSTSWFMNKFFPVIDTETKKTKITGLFKVITDIIESGKVPTTLPTYPLLSSNIKVNINQSITPTMVNQARSIFTYSVINTIATDTDSFVTATYPSTSYSRSKFIQELKNIIVSMLYDMTFGGETGIYRSKSQYTAIGDNLATQNIFNHAKDLARAQITANFTGTVSEVNDMLALITLKFSRTVEFLTTTGYSVQAIDLNKFTNNDTNDMYSKAITLKNLIINNSTPIINDTIAYVKTTFAGGFVYDESICYRDIGFIIDSMAIDIITGGTWQAITAGKSFYKSSSARTVAVGGSHYIQSLNGLQFAKKVGLQVLNKETAIRYQSLPQVTTFATVNDLPSTSIFLKGSTATVVASSRSVSFVDTSDTVVLSNHGLSNGTAVSFSTITSTTGIVTNTTYYVKNATTNNFQLATLAGSILTLTTNGTGVLVSNDSIAKFTSSFNTVLDIIQYGISVAGVPTYGSGIWHVCVSNGGTGYVDQGSPLNNDIFPAKVVVGSGSETLDASNAYGSIVKYASDQDTSLTILSIDSLTQFTVSVAHETSGSVTFSVGTLTGLTATLVAGSTSVTITTGGDTSSLVVGQTPRKTFGTGAFGVVVLTEVDTIQVRLTKPGFYTVNEEVTFGETVRDLNIMVFVETGIYYEDFPLRLSSNVSIKGDEFRRTLIRPRDRISQSPWRKIFFYRDAIIDGLEIGLVDYAGTNYAPTDVTATLDGTTSKIVVTLNNNYQALLSWVGKVITDMNVGLNVTDAEAAGLTSASATINAGTGTTTGTVVSTNLTGTISLNDYVDSTSVPKGSKVSAVSSNTVGSVTTYSFTITFPSTTDTTTSTTTATLRFINPKVGNKKRGKAVVDSVSGNTMNCTVIYPFNKSGTYLSGAWKMYSTLNYGRHYLTDPLDVTSIAKNNKEIDVFLCNEGNRVVGVTFQGQGGFAMVLDPEGNIKTKSPYIQECSSFSQSNNYKRFAGGQFIDGFAGRLYGTITGINDLGITVTVVGELNSGLDVRPPQPPCSFYVRGKRYQIDDVASFDPTTYTAVLTLDKSTPYLYTTTGALTFSDEKSKRDAGYVLDAIASDAALGTNYRSVHAGRSFLKVYSSRITGDLQDLTIAGLTKLISEAKTYISGNTYISIRSTYDANLTSIVGMIANGVNATPALTWSTSSIADDNLARDILQNNKPFLKSEISAYLASTTAFSLSDYPKYNVLTSERDLGYVIDAMTYDMFYGGDSQTKDSAEAFFFGGVSYIPDENAICQAAYTRLKEVLPYVIAGTSVPSVSPGNSISQVLTNAPGSASTYATILSTLSDIVIDYIADGVYSAPRVAARTYPTTTMPSGVGKTAYNLFFTNVVDVVTNQPTKTSTELAIEAVVSTYLKNGASLRINLETGGNRSMLGNDFAMFNDLAYGILATNGAFTEQVCTFTYYAHTGLWANNGSNIRGVGCSNTFGDYGMRASGYDVTELPDSANLANHMVQTACVYKQGTVANEMTPTATIPATAVWIIGYDYIPTNGAILEIDHSVKGGTLSSYTVTSVEYTTIQVNSQPVIKLSLNTADTGTSSGLAKELYNGELVSIRSTKSYKFVNIDNVKPTRPSTALQYVDSLNDVYRIIAYNLSESTGDTLGNNIAILQSDNAFSYYTFSTDTKGIITGDPASSIYATVAVNGGKTTSTTLVVATTTGILVGHTIYGIGWAGQTVTTVNASATMSASNISGTTLTVGTVSGTIVVGMYLTGGTIPANTFITANLSGSGAGSTWTVSQSVTATGSITITGVGPLVLSAVPTTTPYGTVYFTYKTQGSKIGDTKISVNQVSQLSIIDQVNKGTFVTTYNGRLHRVLRYVVPTFAVSKTFYSYTSGTSTLVVSGTATSIVAGSEIIKRNAVTEEFEFTGIVSSATYDGTTYTSIVVTTPVLYTTITAGLVTFGRTSTGYIEISPNALINNAATGISVNSLNYVSQVTQTGSTIAQIVTFDIPFSNDNLLPKVDSYITVANNSNSNYNGDHQVVGIVNQTVVTLSANTDITTFAVGMVVTSQVTIQSVSTVGGITTFTSTASHNMLVNDPITANIASDTNGFVKGSTYFVKTTPTSTSFTLSATQGGSALGNFGIVVASGVVITAVATSANQSVFTTNINHGISNGTIFAPNISTNGFIAGTTYYFKDVTANTFNLSDTLGGTALGSFGTTTDFFISVSLKTPQTASIPGGSAIIQAVSTDTLVKTITISPASWIPANSPIRASLAASVTSVTINQGGSGYTSAPTLTIDGGSPTQRATATCTIVNGVINEVRVIIKGNGYVSVPSITITPALGNIPTSAAVLTVNLSTAVLREATSSSGASTVQLSALYATDPSTFGSVAALPVTFTTLTVSAATKASYTYNSVVGYSVRYTVSGTSLPSNDTWCKVRLSGTTSFNGAYQVISTDSVNHYITLFYPTDPGTVPSGGNLTSTTITLPNLGAAVTFTDSGDLVTLNSHGLSNGNVVTFSSITSTTGISIDTSYYAINVTTNTFQVSSNNSTALALTTNGTGTLKVSNNSFSVTYTVTGTLPAVSSWCNITGNYNALYNGFGLVTAASGSAVTVLYPLNPGSYTFTGLLSATGTIGATITGTGPWTATITGLSSVVGFDIGSSLIATAGTGTLYGGNPSSVVVTSIVSPSSITYTVTGGTTPTAGTITNLYNTSLPTVTVTSTTTNATSSSLGISKPFSKKDSYTFNIGYAAGTGAQVTTRISTCRATGHDFCDIGTGGYSTTNIPYSIYGEPALSRQVSHETLDESVGRCFYVSTNQDGIFKVGKFFSVDQGTGVVTLSSKTALSNIDAFGFSGGGAVVNQFSTDATMTDNSSNKVPVESSVRGYIDKRLGLDHGGSPLPFASIIGPGFMPLNGASAMTSDLPLGSHRITGLSLPVSSNDAATKGYVDDALALQNTLAELGDVTITSAATSQMLTYSGTKWVNKTLAGDVTIVYSGGTLTSTIGSGKIIDSMVSATAAIDQTKLLLDNAGTTTAASIAGATGARTLTTATLTFATQATIPFATGTRIAVSGFTTTDYNGSFVVTGGSTSTVTFTISGTAATPAIGSGTITAFRGATSFNSTEFTVSSGWTKLSTGSTTSGVSTTKMQYIPANTLLGNRLQSDGPVTTISPGLVVSDGDGIKNAKFGSGTTALLNYVMLVSYDGASTSNNSYSVVGTSSTGDLRNKIVKTGSIGDIDAEQYKIDSYKVIDTITSGLGTPETTKVVFTTPGASDFLTAVGNGTNGAPVVVKVLGSLDVSNNTISASTLTYSGTNVSGTLSGAWALPSGSSFDATQGTFLSSGAGLLASDSRPTVKPTVLFDFANSRTLDPRITFIRNSVGTYFDSAGMMQTAITNQPRFSYNSVTKIPMGLLIEESRTNWLTYSAAFTTGTGHWTDTRITRDTLTSGVTAPDGTIAIKFTANSGTAVGTPAMVMFQSALATGPILRTFSIWMKRVTGTGNVKFTMDANTPVVPGISEPTWYTIPLTTTLTRYVFTNPTSDHGVGIKLEAAGDAIVMWGAQLEEGGMETSYIPTTSTYVIRDSDTVYVDGTNFSRWYNQHEGTIVLSQTATSVDTSTDVKDYGGVFIENVDQSTTISLGALTTGSSSMVYKAIGKTATSTVQFGFTGVTTVVVNNIVTHAVAYRAVLTPVAITSVASVTTTKTFTSIAVINGVYPGATIAVTSGTGAYPAGTYVVSVSGTTLVTSQAPSTQLSASAVITVTNAVASYITNGDLTTLRSNGTALEIYDPLLPMKQLNIGNATGAQIISKLAYYPIRLTDAEIQSITTQ
jgi:hypothetical protein